MEIERLGLIGRGDLRLGIRSQNAINSVNSSFCESTFPPNWHQLTVPKSLQTGEMFQDGEDFQEASKPYLVAGDKSGKRYLTEA
ncbi:hypothetical protein [Paraburkholderia silvatlantica]|uniref:Uncharacterized protein n=1 Tax=Paraburkholderia silvatlantica TaxID=321895 RepID=A0ABR6FNF4_9BURK|nr:hypothetical protein [Paraburkholderia silvatlantica]MBB2928652.1 hypothetical protein [Paraburkholderia silvatlantica]PVY35238.1 hypothetical protein C7411_10531 [Paraburkholderia silvatlantica]PXW40880.1 hypothetical protein C7413_10331 [Paraburkholderia silvatlantica]